MSRELVLNMSVSLDGFVAGPNGETDWIFRNSTEESRAWAVERLGRASLHAMGRASYQAMADFWPTSANPFAEPMNRIPKAVFSRTGVVDAPSMDKTTAAVDAGTVEQSVLDSWQHPTVGGVDLVADIQRLKQGGGGPINALGGAGFASSLLVANLVDLIQLSVHPVVLGRGIPIFAELQCPLHLKLEDLNRFASGIVVKSYRPVTE